MKALLYYLVQVLVTSGILYAYYHFALRNKKFHRYNRFYLLAATVISITIPFLNIPVYFTQSETDSSFVLQSLTVFSSAGSDVGVITPGHATRHSNWFTWENLSCFFYILIASIALLKIILSLLKIRKVAKNNPVEQLGKIHFVNTNEPGTPFSFFRWLFWNRKIELHSEKGEQIFRHELFHIKQKHSWDIIYMELLTVIFWINPFFYLMKKETKAIHEFLADQFTITENTKWQYAELLLMQALNTSQRLVNPFFHNQIKRRIAMITTSKKPSYQYLRKVMVLPVVIIVVSLFAFTYKERQNDKKDLFRKQTVNISDTTKPLAADNKIYDKVEIEPSFPGGEAKWRQYLEKNLDVSVPAKKHAPDGTYTVIIEFIVDKEGKISDIKSLTDHAYGMEEEAMRVIRLGPMWIPAIQNGQQINAYKRQIITFVVGKGEKYFPADIKTTDNEAVVMVESTQNKNNNALGIPGNIAEYNDDLLVVDGKVIGKIKDYMENAGLVNSVHVTVLGPKDAIKKYGEQGKNGAWEAYTLKSNAEDYLNDTNLTKPRVGTIDKIFDKANTPPSFPGGDSAWKRYLNKNIHATLPLDSGAPAGTYKTIIQFIVHEDGFLSDVKALTNYGYGMENEAMRVIKMGPKWIPAKQNGHLVRAYMQQPVTFAIAEEEGEYKQNSLQPTITTLPGIPKISIDELKKRSVYKLLQLPEGTEIISFMFTIDSENGDIIQISNTGSSFNYKIRNLINTAKPGRLITFDMIIISKDGQQKRMPAKAYAITD